MTALRSARLEHLDGATVRVAQHGAHAPRVLGGRLEHRHFLARGGLDDGVDGFHGEPRERTPRRSVFGCPAAVRHGKDREVNPADLAREVDVAVIVLLLDQRRSDQPVEVDAVLLP